MRPNGLLSKAHAPLTTSALQWVPTGAYWGVWGRMGPLVGTFAPLTTVGTHGGLWFPKETNRPHDLLSMALGLRSLLFEEASEM